MEYEFINPSDPYTFRAKDRETAALVVFLLGTAYGAKSERDIEDENVPVFLFGGGKEWYEETFGRTPDDGLKALKGNVADALDSFMLGHFKDRRVYEAALEAIDDPEKRERFKEEWLDSRTS